MEKWQKHVRVSSLVPNRHGDLTACGLTVRATEWTFDGESHARRNVAEGKPLRPCPDCARQLGIESKLRACRRFTLVMCKRHEVHDTRASVLEAVPEHNRHCWRCPSRAMMVLVPKLGAEAAEGVLFMCSHHANPVRVEPDDRYSVASVEGMSDREVQDLVTMMMARPQ